MKRSVFILAVLFLSATKIFSQDILTFNKPYIPYPDTVLIFTPDNYNNGKNDYPLVFLLHGWSGNYTQWNTLINLKEYANKYGFVIVCPDGFYDSWYTDNLMRKNYQFEKFFWNDLIPEILFTYRIDIKNIFISGLSMGGHGALTLFFKNPYFFKSAGSTSGILNLTKFPGKWNLNLAYGNWTNNKKNWLENSAVYLVKNIKDLNKQIIVDCGSEDFAFNVNREFFDKCKALNIKIKFITRPGTHSAGYWRKSIKQHFDFFKKIYGK